MKEKFQYLEFYTYFKEKSNEIIESINNHFNHFEPYVEILQKMTNNETFNQKKSKNVESNLSYKTINLPDSTLFIFKGKSYIKNFKSNYVNALKNDEISEILGIKMSEFFDTQKESKQSDYIFNENKLFYNFKDEFILNNDTYVVLEILNNTELLESIYQYILSMRFFGYGNIIIAFANKNIDSKNYNFWLEKYSNELKKQDIESNIKYIINNNICSIKNIESRTLLNNKKAREMRHYSLISQADLILQGRKSTIEGKYCVISGLNESSLNFFKALNFMRAKVIALSDENGVIYDENGLKMELIYEIFMQSALFPKDNMLKMYAKNAKCAYFSDKYEIFKIPCFALFLNDSKLKVSLKNAKEVLQNGCKIIVESAPCIEFSALKYILESRLCFMPFSLNFISNLLPLHIYDNFDDFSEELNKFYNLAFFNANILKFPTNLLLGIMCGSFLDSINLH